MGDRYRGPLPPEAVRDFPSSSRRAGGRAVLVDVPQLPAHAATSGHFGCGALVALLGVIALVGVGMVVYIVITENRLERLENRVDDLKEAVSVSSSSKSVSSANARLRMDAVLERQPMAPVAAIAAPPPPPPPHPSRPPMVVAEKPKWASELRPHWLQFETPVDDVEFRLPPSDSGLRGLYAASENGYTLECVFGERNVQPARTAIALEFHINDETDEEYAIGRVIGPAFRGRACAIEWMARSE